MSLYFRIIVSLLNVLLLFSLASCGGKVNTLVNGRQGTDIVWDVPISNIDGTPLTGLAGYRIHYGTAPGNYTGTVDITGWNVTHYAISNFLGPFPQAGTVLYVTVAARDYDNSESTYSNEITIIVVEPEQTEQAIKAFSPIVTAFADSIQRFFSLTKIRAIQSALPDA
jgi:hypothetical protein